MHVTGQCYIVTRHFNIVILKIKVFLANVLNVYLLWYTFSYPSLNIIICFLFVCFYSFSSTFFYLHFILFVLLCFVFHFKLLDIKSKNIHLICFIKISLKRSDIAFIFLTWLNYICASLIAGISNP